MAHKNSTSKIDEVRSIFVGRVKKSNTSDPCNRLQEFRNHYITSQPQTSGLNMIQQEFKTISKTQAKKGREKLSKNNFKFDLEGNPITMIENTSIPKWMCHKHCSRADKSEMIDKYTNFKNNIFRYLLNFSVLWSMETESTRIRLLDLIDSIEEQYYADYSDKFVRPIGEYKSSRMCINALFTEFEWLRLEVSREIQFLSVATLQSVAQHSNLLDFLRSELRKVHEMDYIVFKFVDEHQYKGIPKEETGRTLTEEEILKIYMRNLKEVYYSRRTRWRSNTNFKHPILSKSFKTIATEIFANPIETIFDKVQEFRKNVEAVPIDGKPNWFKMVRVTLHVDNNVVDHEINVYQRFSQYIANSEIATLDRFVVNMIHNYKIHFLLFCALLHMTCLIFDVPTTWCYVIYVTVFARYLIWATLFKLTDVITEGIEPAIKKVSSVIGDKLTEVGRDLSGQYNILETLGKGLNKHKVGLTACVYDITTAESPAAVMSEVVKIGSMLELETSVANSIMGRISTTAGNMLNPQVVNEHAFDFEKVVPLIAMGATMAGKQITDVNMGANMNMMAMNIKNTKVIYDAISEAAKGLGLVEDYQSKMIINITRDLVEVKKDFEWVMKCLAVSGNEFLKPEGKIRFNKFKVNVDQMTEQMRELKRTKLEKTQVVTEANSLLIEIRRHIMSVELILQRVSRVIPVGICLFGSSQVGKTTLSDEIHSRLREQAHKRHPDLFQDSMSWTKWNTQDRDEYDQNYLGDEVMYADDAFSSKDNLDHQKYLSFISSGAVSTVQADLKAKGRPFNVKVVMTSCNVLPHKSVAINNVQALWERFPITLNCKIKDGITPRSLKEYDRDFKHLEFLVGPMTNHIGKTEGNKRDGLTTKTLDEIIDMIIDRMAVEQDKADQALMRQEEEETIEVDLRVDEHVAQENISTVGNAMPSTDNITFDSKTWRLVRTALSHPTESVYDFKWVKHLKLKTTNQTWAEAHEQKLVDLDPYDFLMRLGVWTWIEGEEEEGWKDLLSQPPIVIEDTRTTSRYLFFPAMCGDKNLVLITDAIETILSSPNFYIYVTKEALIKVRRAAINDLETFKEILQGCWREYFSKRGIIRFSINVTTSILLGPFSTVNRYFTWINFGLLKASQTRRFHRIIFGENSSLFMVGYKIYSYQSTAIDYLYTKIEKFVQIVGDTVYEMLLKIFEFIGIDIGPWIDSFLSITGEIVNQTLCFAVVSIIVYALYKIYQLLTKPTIKKIRHHHGAYNGNHKFTGRKMKKETRKQVQLHQASEDCTEECSFETTRNDIEWDYFGESTDFYSGEWLQRILETVNNDEGYYVSHYECNDYICTDLKLEIPALEVDGVGLIYNSHDYKINPLDDTKVPYVRFDFNGQRNEWKIYKEVLQMLRKLNICEYLIEFNLKTSRANNTIFGTIGLYILKGESLEYIGPIERKEFIKVMSSVRVSNQQMTPQAMLDQIFQVTKVEEHSSTAAVELGEQLRENQVVHVTLGTLDSFDEREDHNLFAIGHKNMLIMNGHAFMNTGSLVKFWIKDPSIYWIAQVKILQQPGDRAYLQILNYKDLKAIIPEGKCKGYTNQSIVFRDLTKHLISEHDLLERYEYSPAVMMTHRLKMMMAVNVQHRKPQVYVPSSTERPEMREWYAINGLKVDSAYKRDGECGSPIITCRLREAPKVIGFYSASAGDEHFCTTLWKESVECADTLINPSSRIVEHITSVFDIPMMSQTDPWLNFCSKGTPIDTPDGPEVQFIGNYARCTRPVSRTTLDHWNLSPFHQEFKEQLQPAPLNPNDVRIESQLPTNRNGQPSLLAVLNHTISESLPIHDEALLDYCSKVLEDEYNNILEIGNTPDDINDLLHMAMNGKEGAEYVTGMEINKAAGLPWATMKAQMKSDMIEIDAEGTRKFKKNDFGVALRSRCIYKLKQANKSVRVVSFSNAKLKDAAVKLDYVAKGRGRIYHCIPVEKVISDAALFGQFKEAYTKAGLKINSAVGINPHSMGVQGLVEHLQQHSHFVDADFTNFDQRIARSILLHVGILQCNIIKKQNPKDVWDTARRTLIIEDVDTIVVEYQDLTLTNRGNKSGEFKTTINNNIVRELCDYYSWCKLKIGDQPISSSNIRQLNIRNFREERTSIGFGDDEVEGISHKLIDEYNFLTKKKILNSIGMVVTPGSKTLDEKKSTPFEDISFLKRKFRFQHGMWTMPLDCRSLEAPFVWTKIPDYEHDIWYELVKDRIYEAVLHGRDYYEDFVKKLAKCSNRTLLLKINPLIIQPYDIVVEQYKKIYYE